MAPPILMRLKSQKMAFLGGKTPWEIWASFRLWPPSPLSPSVHLAMPLFTADYEAVQYAGEYDFLVDDTNIVFFPDGT